MMSDFFTVDTNRGADWDNADRDPCYPNPRLYLVPSARRQLALSLLVYGLALVALFSCTPPLILPPPPTPTGMPMPTPASTYAEPITNLVVAPDGAVWYSYGSVAFHPAQDGVRRLAQGQETHFGVADGLPSDNVQVLKVAPDGAIWAGAGCAVARYSDQKWQTLFADCAGQGNILDLAFAPDGVVWVASGFALLRFDGKTWTRYERLINSVAVTPDGTLWVSGWEGTQDSWFVAHVQGDEWEIHNTLDTIGAAVGQIVSTSDGTVWGIVGTEEHSTVQFAGKTWVRHNVKQPFPGGYLSSLKVAPAGQLWAISDGRVVRFTGQQWQTLPDLPTGVTALAFGLDDTLWLATNQGIKSYATPGHSHP